MKSDLTLIKRLKVYYEERSHFCSGLCLALAYMQSGDLLSKEERVHTLEILKTYKPKKMYENTLYWFEPFSLAPRLKLLNKIIKDLEDKK